MRITINGKDFEMEEAMTLADALTKASIRQDGVATALNGNVITASMRGKIILADGDKITVIKAFYGG